MCNGGRCAARVKLRGLRGLGKGVEAGEASKASKVRSLFRSELEECEPPHTARVQAKAWSPKHLASEHRGAGRRNLRRKATCSVSSGRCACHRWGTACPSRRVARQTQRPNPKASRHQAAARHACKVFGDECAAGRISTSRLPRAEGQVPEPAGLLLSGSEQTGPSSISKKVTGSNSARGIRLHPAKHANTFEAMLCVTTGLRRCAARSTPWTFGSRARNSLGSRQACEPAWAHKSGGAGSAQRPRPQACMGCKLLICTLPVPWRLFA